MTIHALFAPPVVPMPRLFPRGMDATLGQRQESIRLATYCVKQTGHPYSMAARYLAWADRMSARIAQVAK